MQTKNKFTLFILPIVIILGLLVIQALCDLALPEYTSNIINNGIGHNGISSGIPEVIPEHIFNLISKISKENKSIVTGYDLIVKDNLSKKDLSYFKEKYPIIANENIYLLNDLSEEQKATLEHSLSKPLILATLFDSNNEQVKKMLKLELPENVTLTDWLMNLDKDTFNQVITEISKTYDKLDESMLNEYSYLSVSNIYKTVGIDMNAYQISYIINMGLKMLIIAGIGMIVAIIVGYLSSKLASQISYTLRDLVVTKIMSFSPAEFKEFGASSLITRATNDIEQIKMFCIMLVRIVIFAPIMGIGAFVKVCHNPLNWLIAVALITILVLISILFAIAMPKFNIMQKLIDRMNLVSREIITGMPVIRTFGTEKYEEERFDTANKNLTNNNLFVNRLMGIMMPSMMLVMNIISILIVWYGAKEINVGSLQVGTLLAFISYTMQIIMSFLMISLVSVMLPRALISIRRIKEILNKKVSIVEPSAPLALDSSKKGYVEFKNVTFQYPDADEAMLKNISFIAKPGTTTAFIGSTGSGKSTLINLIPRFYEATKGTIYVDGVDVKKASLKELREVIGYVPQKGILFSGTIKSNLELGKDNLTPEELENSASVSQSLEFIETKEKGFNSPISQGGTNVSGGQKQRLSIARAIAKNPEIYIFDDSFSALDFKTDAKLRQALKKHAHSSTILIVAQRISTIMNADNIIVLNEGEIVGSGTHKELLKNCPIYKEIALSQMKEEEL